MSTTQKVYLETTVWYQLVNFSSSGFKKRAEQLLRLIGKENLTIYISTVVLDELSFNTSRYRERIEELIKEFKPLVLMGNAEVDTLASAYMENAYRGYRPHEVFADAFHAAIATVSSISYIASYNFRHLLNVRTQEQIYGVNLLAGYNHPLTVAPPFMFLKLDEYYGDTGTVEGVVWDMKTQYGGKLETRLNNGSQNRPDPIETSTAELIERCGLATVSLPG